MKLASLARFISVGSVQTLLGLNIDRGIVKRINDGQSGTYSFKRVVGDITEHCIMDPHAKLIGLGHLANYTEGANKIRKGRKLLFLKLKSSLMARELDLAVMIDCSYGRSLMTMLNRKVIMLHPVRISIFFRYVCTKHVRRSFLFKEHNIKGKTKPVVSPSLTF